ncbi:Radical SAM [Pseudoalteromonas luteoviolacea B = ATCC 29581]|nr:Radical SAM [Pseudoalteromonas luteoviolacea B = ATCC 29581]
MSDKYSIDSHKLMLHPARVAKWQEGTAQDNWEILKKVYPIYVEISPFGGCNHRCTFCALDYMGYKNIAIDYQILENTIGNMASVGIKSVMFAGEGEPLLFKNLDKICAYAKSVGIDSALTTNFVPLRKQNIELLMESCSWIKVSLNAGTAKSYAEIHQTKERDFDTVIDNLKMAISHKRAKNLTCTLGAQMVLLPENMNEAVILAQLCKSIGLDYLVIKPYSQHLSSHTNKYEFIDYTKMYDIEKELEKLNDDKFNVVFRINTMKKFMQKKQPYKKCNATPFFWAYIATDGKVFGCSAHLGKDNFCYGNINDNSFSEIWEGEKRKESYIYVQSKLDIKDCRINCRMDEVNRYLDRLQSPFEHDNFI